MELLTSEESQSVRFYLPPPISWLSPGGGGCIFPFTKVAETKPRPWDYRYSQEPQPRLTWARGLAQLHQDPKRS